MDLRTFRHRSFSVAAALIAVVMITLFGTLILLPIYLQNVLGVDTLTTGLILLPGGLLMGALAPVVGSLFDRVGARVLVIPGTIGLAVLLLWMTSLDEASAVWTIVTMHVVMSICLAFMFTPLFTSALGSLPATLYAHGSAIIGTIQQVAGAIGTALFITAMTVASAASAAAGESSRAATADGFHAAVVIGAVVAALSVGVALFLPRRQASAAVSAPAGH
jgi:DHA2 family lincomycin resistance protein-like MFS transporter